MQTFLPFSDFEKSLSCLDDKRLGKQRVEAAQIINIISGNAKPTKTGKIAWINHPAVKQWNGYSDALKLYFNISVSLWIKRNKNNTYKLFELPQNITFPDWLGHEPYHLSHRSNLLRKNKTFYSQYGWTESDDIPYFWPSKEFKK